MEWGRAVLADPISLLIDHAFLEKKAAANAMELLTRWPNEWVPGWVETMTGIARDETAHFAGGAELFVADALDEEFHHLLRLHLAEMEFQAHNDPRGPMHSPEQHADSIFR